MPTSQEDLNKKAEAVQRLRQQVADAEAERLGRESELANDITLKQLETEEALLKARLATVREGKKVSSVKQGAEAPLSAAKEQMERALAQQKAAEASGESSKRATESTSAGTASGDTASKASGGSSEKDGK